MAGAGSAKAFHNHRIAGNPARGAGDMAVNIHPTAIVDAGAKLADGVEIGPFCTVSSKAVLSDNVRLVSHVSIAGSTTVGARTVIYPFATLGHPPQDSKYKGEDTQLIVGTDNQIREGACLHLGTVHGRGRTVVGNKCLIMNGAHVGHDGLIGNGVTYATHAVTGGLAIVEDSVILGGNSAIHQFGRVGMAAFIGGCAPVVGDVIPYGMVDNSGGLHGLNIVGLKRRNVSRETIHLLRNIYQVLFHGPGYFEDRLASITERHSDVPEVKRILDFIDAGEKRPLCVPRHS